MRAFLLVLALVLSVACSMVQPTTAPLGTEQNPLKLALASSTDTQKALTAGQPLVTLIEQETGLHVQLSVPTSHAATIEAMGTHNLDVGWLAPVAYLLAHDRVGADALLANVRGGSTTTVGQIVVRADSGITSLKELRGTRFAFADDASVVGYHLPVALLKAQGLDPPAFFAEAVFAGGDDAVLMAVYSRQVAGGAIVGEGMPGQPAVSESERTVFHLLPADLAEQVRTIARTEPIPNETLTIRKGIAPELARKLRDGLLRVAASPAGATVLRELFGIDGLAPMTDAEFEPLRAAIRLLDLSPDVVLAPGRRGT